MFCLKSLHVTQRKLTQTVLFLIKFIQNRFKKQKKSSEDSQEETTNTSSEGSFKDRYVNHKHTLKNIKNLLWIMSGAFFTGTVKSQT